MTEAVYNNLSGKIEPANKINLSAQTIKDAGTIFPVLQDIVKEARTEEYFNSNKPSKITTTENDLNKALIVLEKGYIDIQQSKLSILKKLNLEGSYDLSTIEIDNSSSLGDFSTATFTGSNITVDKINTARGTSLPTLSNISLNRSYDNTKDGKEIYNLYKAYSEKLNFIDLNGSFSAIVINGKQISGDPNYTLFKNGTEAKSSNDDVISLFADAMVKMTEQLKIYRFYNMIVSKTASKSSSDPVNWELVNIVFEGDMSKITHNASRSLYGIIYFKKKTYNTSKQYLYGMLKLKKLYNDNNFTITVNEQNSVIDVRDIADSDIISYTGGINQNGTINSIYFNASLASPDTNNPNETDSKNYREKFRAFNGRINNIYFGEKRTSGYNYFNSTDSFYPSSRIPRSLKDFEALGNSYIDSNGENMEFPTSARDSYNDTQFNSLDPVEQQKLNADKNSKELAKNDKRIDSRIV